MNMEAIGYSETLVTTYEIIQCHIPEDYNLNLMDCLSLCVCVHDMVIWFVLRQRKSDDYRLFVGSEVLATEVMKGSAS
jgi:hypothetical protein